MREYKYLSLSKIAKYEDEMENSNVSEVARSPRGFLTYYKKIGGKRDKVNDYWKNRRDGFIKRHMVQYRKNPTKRRRLSLIAWAYEP